MLLTNNNIDENKPTRDNTNIYTKAKSGADILEYENDHFVEYPKRPQTVVMNMPAFKEWFYYCKEHNMDYTTLDGMYVMLDKTAPDHVAFVAYSWAIPK